MNVLEHQIYHHHYKGTKEGQHQGPEKTYFSTKNCNTRNAPIAEPFREVFLLLSCSKNPVRVLLCSTIAAFYHLQYSFQTTFENRHLVEWKGVQYHVFCYVQHSCHHDLLRSDPVLINKNLWDESFTSRHSHGVI